MFCPRCGQQQVSDQIRFCSRCGFLMTGLAQVVADGGLPQSMDLDAPRPKSPRRRGLKQGGALFLFGIFFVPIFAILSEMLKFNDELVALAAVVFFLGGFLRMVYAVIFESGNPGEKTLEENVVQTAQKFMNKKPSAGALPPQQSIPVDAYAPPRAMNWRDTNDLEPTSVTDETTKLLNKNQ
jgi:hypothetical protein